MKYSHVDECLSKVNGVPLIIPTFNNMTYTKNIVDFFCQKNHENIIIIDNASTFEPMIDYLNNISNDIDVVFQNKNYGPRQIHSNNLYYLLPQYFIITDPDLAFNNDFPDNFIDMLIELHGLYQTFKIGSALNLNILDSNILDVPYVIHKKTQTIRNIEESYYTNKIDQTDKFNIWKAPIDTTFSMYNKNNINFGFFESLRLDGIFLADHYGWYEPPPIPQNELDFYRNNIVDDISSTEILKKYGVIY